MRFEEVLIYLRTKRTNRARLPSWRGLYHLRIILKERPYLVVYSDEDDGWHYAELTEEELMSNEWEVA